MTEHPFPYEGPEELRQPILTALRRVVDPEVALNVVDVGLIYGVTVANGKLHAQVTMTSAACPVTDVILEDIETQLDRDMPPELLIQVELVWSPPLVHRPHERAGSPLHGMVTPPPPSAPMRTRVAPARPRTLAPLVLILVALALVSGITGGLVRAGVPCPPSSRFRVGRGMPRWPTRG